jgi:hypothetical protein
MPKKDPQAVYTEASSQADSAVSQCASGNCGEAKQAYRKGSSLLRKYRKLAAGTEGWEGLAGKIWGRLEEARGALRKCKITKPADPKPEG